MSTEPTTIFDESEGDQHFNLVQRTPTKQKMDYNRVSYQLFTPNKKDNTLVESGNKFVKLSLTKSNVLQKSTCKRQSQIEPELRPSISLFKSSPRTTVKQTSISPFKKVHSESSEFQIHTFSISCNLTEITFFRRRKTKQTWHH